jgi:hypothetical protein
MNNRLARSWLLLLVVVWAQPAGAAPAPFPKPERNAPTIEQVIAELREHDIQVRNIKQVDADLWDITVYRPATVILQQTGKEEKSMMEDTHRIRSDDLRAALRYMRTWGNAPKRTKP